MPDHDMTDDETRSVAPADRHPLIQTALLVRLSQPLEEQLAVYNQRRKALRWFEITREKLAADPTATEDDLAFLDNHIRWWREKLDAGDNQLERRRLKTRERVARWRARICAPLAHMKGTPCPARILPCVGLFASDTRGLGLRAIGEHMPQLGELGVAVLFHEPGDVVAPRRPHG
jgi:hypothetical protein